MTRLHLMPSGNQALDAVARRIKEVSTLPAVALRVMQIAGDPDSGAADLKEVMESDAALSARVLRCVNSSAYGVRKKITNLQQAIAYLGVKQIRNLAMTASVSELFKSDDAIGPYRRSQLWRHLVSVGICARMLARRLGFDNGEDMFLAGLLHDLGIILEDQQVHGTFRRVIESLREGRLLSAVERNLLRFDHTQLGERLAEMWGFPEAVRSAMRHHHASANYRGPDQDLVRCVEVGNILCSLKGVTSVGMFLVQISLPAFSTLSLGKDDIVALDSELDAALEANRGLFSV